MKYSSTRKYKVAISDNAGISIEGFILNTILHSEEDAEVLYAMREVIDQILDLYPGEPLYFHPNRDDKSTKGIIRRVS